MKNFAKDLLQSLGRILLRIFSQEAAGKQSKQAMFNAN